MSIKNLINTYDNIPQDVGKDRAESIKIQSDNRSQEAHNKAFQNLANVAAGTVKMLTDAKKARDMVKAQDVLNQAGSMQVERMAELSELSYDQLDERISSSEFKDRNSHLVAQLDKLNPKATAKVRKELEFRQAKERLQLEAMVNKKTADHTNGLFKKQLQVAANKIAADPASMEDRLVDGLRHFAHLPLSPEQRKDINYQFMVTGFQSKLSGLTADKGDWASLQRAEKMLEDPRADEYLTATQRKVARNIINSGRPKPKKKASFENVKFVLRSTNDGSFSQFSAKGIEGARGVEYHGILDGMGRLFRGKAINGEKISNKEVEALLAGGKGKEGIEFRRLIEPSIKGAIKNFNAFTDSSPVDMRRQLLEGDLLKEGTEAMSQSNQMGRALTNDTAENLGNKVIEAALEDSPDALGKFVESVEKELGRGVENVRESLKYLMTQKKGGVTSTAAGILYASMDARVNTWLAPHEVKQALSGVMNGTLKKGKTDPFLSSRLQKYIIGLSSEVRGGIMDAMNLIAENRLSRSEIPGNTPDEQRKNKKEMRENILQQIGEEAEENVPEPDFGIFHSVVSYLEEKDPTGAVDYFYDGPKGISLTGAHLVVKEDDDPREVGKRSSRIEDLLNDEQNMNELLTQHTQLGRNVDLLSPEHRKVVDGVHDNFEELNARYTLEQAPNAGDKILYNLALTTSPEDGPSTTTVLDGADGNPLVFSHDDAMNSENFLVSDDAIRRKKGQDDDIARSALPASPTVESFPPGPQTKPESLLREAKETLQEKEIQQQSVSIGPMQVDRIAFSNTFKNATADNPPGNVGKLARIVEIAESGTKGIPPTRIVAGVKRVARTKYWDVGSYQVSFQATKEDIAKHGRKKADEMAKGRAEVFAKLPKETQFLTAGKILDDSYASAKEFLGDKMPDATIEEKKAVMLMASYLIYNGGRGSLVGSSARQKETADNLLNLVRTGKFPSQVCTGHDSCKHLQKNILNRQQTSILDLIESVKKVPNVN